MIGLCTNCGRSFDAGSEEAANEPGCTCRSCWEATRASQEAAAGTQDVAGTAPIVMRKRTAISAVGIEISPTAVTMPDCLASIAGDLDRGIDSLGCVLASQQIHPLTPSERELLVNSATALKHIAEAAAGALGVLARAGIKPLES